MSARSLIPALLALAVPAAAQNVVYVDPTFGTNTPGQNPSVTPFRTIQAAIDWFGLMGTTTPTAAAPVVVRCLPGIYSNATNGELFPIFMEDYINVESVGGATSTVIIGRQNSAPYSRVHNQTLPGVFLPTPPSGSRSTDIEVLVDGSDLESTYQETFDGFTMRGGDIQFYIEVEEANVEWTISNCVLDMLDNPLEQSPSTTPPVPGPTFGCLEVSTWNFSEGHYHMPVTHFLNNTVVMGWQGSGDPLPPTSTPPTAISNPNAVGFCDVNDPVLMPGYAPLPVEGDPEGADRIAAGLSALWSVSTPNIQNSLFRTLASQGPNTLALLGIDTLDVSVAQGGGSRSGPTCGFDVLRALDVNAAYESERRGPVPTLPWIDVNPANPAQAGGVSRDPGFVGEYISRTGGSRGAASITTFDERGRDWRILPTSAYVDAGSNPLHPTPDSPWVLVAQNGARYDKEPELAISYDWDGEGVGNPRISVDTTMLDATTATVDIGFDEAGPLILARSYSNDGRVHGQVPMYGTMPYPSGVANGRLGGTREVIVPAAGVVMALVSQPAPFVPPAPGWTAWPSLFSLSLPTDLPVFGQLAGPPGLTNIYVDLANPPLAPVSIPSSITYLAPFEAAPLVGHTFGSLTFDHPNYYSLGPDYRSWQFVYNPAGTTKAYFSNAQSEIH